MKQLVCGKTEQLSFRLRLARQLIGSFSSRMKRGPVPVFMPPKRGVIGVPDEVRCTVGRHIPKSSGTRRRCRYCSTKSEDKRTKIICSSCNVRYTMLLKISWKVKDSWTSEHIFTFNILCLSYVVFYAKIEFSCFCLCLD